MSQPKLRVAAALALVIFAGLLAAPRLVPQGQLAAPEPAVTADEGTSGEFLVARPDFEWSFPRDHFKHDGYRTEWWYFTGHLESSEGKRFGYQFTFFRVGVRPGRWGRVEGASAWETNNLLMGHASISSIDSGTHVFSEMLYRESPLLGRFHPFEAPPDDPTTNVGWARAPAGTDAPWTLSWEDGDDEGFAFSMSDQRQGVRFALKTRPLKPLVFQGPNGLSRKGRSDDAASQYYSFTRLETVGSLEMDGETHLVTGQSWMDKEFSSSQLTAGQVGWDWFSLQFEDGTELMLYRLRREDGSTDYANATFVPTDGEPRYLGTDAWSLESLDTWTSEETGATYPSAWRLRLDGQAWEIRPAMSDQENRSRIPGGVYYWEGAVRVTALGPGPEGLGYVELTGYGENNRPPV